MPTADPLHPRSLRNGAAYGAPAVLGEDRLVRPASDYGDVLAGEGVDAFEGPAIGVEVPEVLGHACGVGGSLQRSHGRTVNEEIKCGTHLGMFSAESMAAIPSLEELPVQPSLQDATA